MQPQPDVTDCDMLFELILQLARRYLGLSDQGTGLIHCCSDIDEHQLTFDV